MPSIITRTSSGADATVKGLPLTNAEIDGNFISINNAIRATGDLTGFTNRTSSTVSFNNGTRTFTLAPSSGSFTVHYKGKEITVSSTLSVQISNSTGGRWITLDPVSVSLQDAGPTVDLTTTIVVGYVYWIAGVGSIIAGDERHLASRDTQWHFSKHNEVGTVWLTGGDCTYTLNDQSTITIGFSDITIADEDLVHSITHNSAPNGYYQQVLLTTASIPVLYKNGSIITQIAASSNPWQVGTLANYNQVVNNVGSIAEATEGYYVNYWIVATNDMATPIKAVMGRTQHQTLLASYNETVDTMDLPFEEMVVLYQVTLRTSASYINKVVISSVRKISGAQNTLVEQIQNGPTHAGLGKLSNDDHLQYVHISTARTITAAHTWSGVQTFTNGIKINTKPTLNVEGTNKSYTDNRALITALMLS
jgi:hypothetical protein